MIKIQTTYTRPSDTVDWGISIGWGPQDDAEEITSYFESTYIDTGKQISRKQWTEGDLIQKFQSKWDSQASWDQLQADTFIIEKHTAAAIAYMEANGITRTRVITEI